MSHHNRGIDRIEFTGLHSIAVLASQFVTILTGELAYPDTNSGYRIMTSIGTIIISIILMMLLAALYHLSGVWDRVAQAGEVSILMLVTIFSILTNSILYTTRLLTARKTRTFSLILLILGAIISLFVTWILYKYVYLIVISSSGPPSYLDLDLLTP